MREILFRGKRTDNGEWVYGHYTKKEVGEFICGKFQKRFISVMILNFSDGGIQYYEVIPETVGQFTGLTDKNGTKIFEGDIVNCVERNSSNLINTSNGKLVSHTTWENNIKETVEFTPASLQRLDYYHRCCGNLEVIGNIHERENK